MAKGFKTGGRDFQPGHNFSKGAPKLPEDIKKMRKLNKEELERILNKYIDMTDEELNAAQKDPSTKAFDRMIMATIMKAVHHGDHRRIEFILERLVGKVKDKVEVTGNANLAITQALEKYRLGETGTGNCE